MFPHFLCIGAQKAGTTWLYDNIASHPQVWMAPVKEIFYFDRPTWLPLALQLCAPGARSLRQHTLGGVQKRLRRRTDTRAAPAARPEPDATATALQPPRHSRLGRALWHARFMLLPRSDAWYGSLFRPGPGQIAGDINPYLARLDHDTVARMHRLMPGARIVYLLRNPVQRIWSQVGMSMRERNVKSLDAIDPVVFRRALELGAREDLSNYMGNIQRWLEFYPSEQLFVGFFDQLVRDPRGLLRSIYEFLGIHSSDDYIPPSAAKKSNAGSGPTIPQEYLEMLTEIFTPQLEALHQHFGNAYTEKWLTEARQVATPSP